MKRVRLGRGTVVFLLGLSAAVAALFLTSAPGLRRLFDPMELTLLDYRVRARAQPPRERSEVVLVLFDSASVREWPYLSPFPRAALADLIDAVSSGRPRAIGLDVNLDRRFPRLDSIDAGDSRLRSAIERAGNVVLAAETVEGNSNRRFLSPDPYFASVAAAVGVTDLPTPFETVRDAVLAARTDSGLVPGFALALYSQARGIDLPALLSARSSSATLSIPGLPSSYAGLPLAGDAVQTVPILFVGPPSRPGRADGAFVAISASDAPLFPEVFRDKVVLLGSGFHSEDAFRTPFYDQPDADGKLFGWSYGAEIHANTLENLLTGSYPIPFGRATMALVGAFALMVTAAAFRRGPIASALVGGMLAVAHVVASFGAFEVSTIHLPIVAPLLAIAIALTLSNGYVSLVEGREKRVIRRAFGQYLSPTIVDQLVADPSALRLGGEKRAVSILFSDIAGFTALSETSDPERLLGFLNQYLDEMTNLVLDEGGTLDKYVGDKVMALYGAPIAQADHALRACVTALRMRDRLVELNRRWTAEGWPEIHIRIGIHSGTPVVGNIGGERRFDYTALGDAVNLADRLEGACKSYEVCLMISEATRLAAGDAIVVRELDLIAVYGRREPVRVYELVGLSGTDLGEHAELLEPFAEGLAAYRSRDFALALQHFQRVADLSSSDGPSRVYIQRAGRYLVTPPPSQWDLVESQLTK